MDAGRTRLRAGHAQGRLHSWQAQLMKERAWPIGKESGGLCMSEIRTLMADDSSVMRGIWERALHQTARKCWWCTRPAAAPRS